MPDFQHASPLQKSALYVGGYEAIGGIEAFLYDLLATLPHDKERALFVWAQDLPALRALERDGIRVWRTALRLGCSLGLPDAVLFARHGHRLRVSDRIVFAKIPPRAIFERIVNLARDRPQGPAELIYVTPYRPLEMWPDGIPDYIARGLDRVLVQSAEFEDDLRQMGFGGAIDLVPYIPPPPATDPVDSPCEERPFRLGFLGRFVPQKNLFYLLDIMEELHGEAIELHLFGGGEHVAGLGEQVAARDLPVSFHGVIAREAVPAAIDSCDAFVNPSVSEGQCLVALEVLSRGRPFLATPVGAIPEILGKGRLGAIIPLDDIAGAAAVLRSHVAAWKAGEWRPGDIARAYAAAYPRSRIIGEYQKLL